MDSSVGIATGEGLGRLRDRLPAGETDFSLFHSVQTGPGAHPTSYTMSTAAVPQGVKRPEDEFHHSSSSSGRAEPPLQENLPQPLSSCVNMDIDDRVYDDCNDNY
jgi:hypothetical protein